MKQINLVPAATRQKAASRRAVPYMLIAGLIGLGATGAAWLGFSLQNRALAGQRDALVRQHTLLEQQANKDLADLNIDADLTSRVTQLNTMAKSDIDWERAFTYLATLLPKEISLSTFSYATANATITLKCSGDAPSNVSYATFAEYLKNITGKQITSFKVDGYTFDPKSGHVTFSLTIIVPQSQVSFLPS